MLKLFNTLTKEIEIFKPIKNNEVKMYVCGITVYDYCHLGHAKMVVSFDIIQRWFQYLGYQVTYVRNITDIDDKIIKKALQENRTVKEITKFYTLEMNKDFSSLFIQSPTLEPRATDYIPQMLSMINILENKGYAYQNKDGDVNFSVERFSTYGNLSGKVLEEMRHSGKNVVVRDKKNTFDFVLWKSAKENEPNEVKYESAYGAGRPGWHIECSAMSCSILGESFDIHGGGSDLQFPHHDNEIAQSESASGKKVANYWMHNGFVNVLDQNNIPSKMSKSENNFQTIRSLLSVYPGEVVRLALIKTHYRGDNLMSETIMNDAKESLFRLYQTMLLVPPTLIEEEIFKESIYTKEFENVMNQDFNTPEALKIIFNLSRLVRKEKSGVLSYILKRLSNTLGLLTQEPYEFLRKNTTLRGESIQELINEMTEARLNKNYEKADQIKSKLQSNGVKISIEKDNQVQWSFI